MSGRGVHFLRDVTSYVAQTWPYFNKSQGGDHFLVMTNDKGSTFIRGAVPRLQKMTLVTQWGWDRSHIHLPGRDVVVPPMLKVTCIYVYIYIYTYV